MSEPRKMSLDARMRIAEKQRQCWASGKRDHQKTGATMHVCFCAYCGIRYERVKPTKFCCHPCSAKFKRGKTTIRATKRYDQINPLILSLYEQGFGAKMIARQVGIAPSTVRRLLIAAGVYQPGKLHPLKGQGKPKLFAPNRITRVVLRMGIRVRKCLNKKPHSLTRGMTAAQRFKWRYQNEPEFHIYQLLRRRMRNHGIGWHNTGTGKGKWHIGHIIPCAAFDLRDPFQQRTCFHWTNLRPEWSLSNIRNGARLDRHLCLSLPFPEIKATSKEFAL